MFRTVANLLSAVGDVLDGMLVGDAELEAVEYERLRRERVAQARSRPADGRLRLLWDADAQDRAYAAAAAEAARPPIRWDGDFSWSDGARFRATAAADLDELLVDPKRAPDCAALTVPTTEPCPSEGRWRAAVMNFATPQRREGAVAQLAFECDAPSPRRDPS